jgi:hypothetical protein
VTNPYSEGSQDGRSEDQGEDGSYFTDEQTSSEFGDQSDRAQEVTRERFGSGGESNDFGTDSSGGESESEGSFSQSNDSRDNGHGRSSDFGN